MTLSPKGSRSLVTATPFPAGHLLGGSVWRITVDAEEIVYAVRERHTQGNSHSIRDEPFPVCLLRRGSGFITHHWIVVRLCRMRR